VDASEAPGTRTLSFVLNDGVTGVSTAPKTIIVRLMRVYSFQQGGDGGFGVYTDAGDIQIVWDDPYTPYPVGQNAAGMVIDYNMNSLLPEDQSQFLLKFSNLIGAGLGQIPPGAKIVFAELTMDIPNVANASGHGALFNRMLGDWNSEAATYDSFGGNGIQLDDVEAISGIHSFLMDVANNTTTGVGLRDVGVTADVQAWADGTNNYGWVASPRTNADNATFFSPCEATNILARPRLRVGWLPASVTAASFQEGTSGYAGTVDTQIRLADPDSTQNNYATYTVLSPDWLVAATPIPNPCQAMIRFDNIIGTGAGQVAPGSKIHAAILELTSINADAQGAGGQFYALLKPWADTNSWNDWVDGISADGIEAAASPTVTLPVEGFGETVQPTTHNVEITADVQAWSSGSLANNGWAVLPWVDGNNGWGFNSADNVEVNMRPLLRVYYDPAPGIVGAVHNGSSVDLTVSGTVGKTYHVVRSGDLTTPTASWTELPGTATIGSGGTATFTDSSPLAGAAFYRVRDP
jgi:hypothetical protein